jgi:probable HAF family extracellular repeat protein
VIKMKARNFQYIIAMTILSVALGASRLAAQDQPNQAAPPQYSVTNLGTFGGNVSSGNSINNLGWAMGNANPAGDATTQAAVWIDGKGINLGTLGGPNSAIEWPVKNDWGVIAGIAETAEIDPLKEDWSCAAFFPPPATKHICLGFVTRWGHLQALSTLGGEHGYASGVNERGEIVGWAETNVHDKTCVLPQILQFEAVFYDADGRVHELPPLPEDQDGAATAINNQGQVVGISGTCDVAVGAYTAKRMVIWQDGFPVEIPAFGGKGWNTPTAINNRGEVVGFANLPGDVVGGVLQFNPIAFIWTPQYGTTKIEPLSGDTNSIAYGINDRGQVVGQSYGGPEGARAFLWQDGKSYDLNGLIPSGSPLYLLYAEGINDRGEITGQACVVSACTTETPAFLAAPQFGWSNSNADALAMVEKGPSATASKLAVPRDVVQKTLKRRGLHIEAATAQLQQR